MSRSGLDNVLSSRSHAVTQLSLHFGDIQNISPSITNPQLLSNSLALSEIVLEVLEFLAVLLVVAVVSLAQQETDSDLDTGVGKELDKVVAGLGVDTGNLAGW